MTRVYLALGSNLADPLHQVDAALAALDALPETQRIATSAFYRTPPYGPADQPDYLNAAVALETQLSPESLLDHTQRIELEHGRVRKAERWGRARWTLTSCCLAKRRSIPNALSCRITTC